MEDSTTMNRTSFTISPTATKTLPEYHVRHSSRARRVNLTISPANGLVVVVPRGFDERLIPGLVHEQRSWIEKKLALFSHTIAANERWLRPTHVALPATNENWMLDYHTNLSATVRISARTDSTLRTTGAVDDRAALSAALGRWLKRRAQQWLPQRLTALATMHEFSYARVTIRNQRSRWGSCSSRGTISLNAKLMFISPELVDHVLLHELCHTIHPNHGNAFHELLADFLPAHRQQRATLREAWAAIPAWAQR